MNSPEWAFEYSDELTKKLKKIKRKNPIQFSMILKKREDIKQKIEENPEHFKNLKYDLSEFKRVHINTHFVLIFKVDKIRKIVRFEDFDHHDKVYG